MEVSQNGGYSHFVNGLCQNDDAGVSPMDGTPNSWLVVRETPSING